MRCGYDGKRQSHFLVPGFLTHICVRVHIILLGADPVPTPHDFHLPIVCSETTFICNARVFLSLVILGFEYVSLEVKLLWGLVQHYVMLSTGQACSAFSLSMARTSLRTSTTPWLWWPSPSRSSLRRRISQSLHEVVLAIQTSGRLAHSSNGEAGDHERWLKFAEPQTIHSLSRIIIHYHWPARVEAPQILK